MWTSIALEMRQIVEQIRHKAGKICSAHAFNSLFLWKEEMQLTILLTPEGYLVRQGARGQNHYFFPCGSDEAKKELLSALPQNAILHYADARDLAFLQQWKPGQYQAQPARGDWEYLYSKQAQIDLSGKRYDSMRKNMRHIRALPGWHALPIDAQTLPLVQQAETEWQSQNYARLGASDSLATQTALTHYDALALTGVIAFLNETPAGFYIGSLLSPDTFYGIAIRSLNSAYFSALRWEMHNALPNHVLTLNLEEDMDIEGLRKNKMLMRPNGFYEMWDIAQLAPEEYTT